MKKTLFMLFCLFFVGLSNASAQWEKIAPQLFEGTFSGYNTNVVQYGKFAAVLVQGNENAYVYYSDDAGLKWKKFKTPEPTAGFIYHKQFAFNEHGFFILRSHVNSNKKIIIHRTTDFGITWSLDSVNAFSGSYRCPGFFYNGSQFYLRTVESILARDPGDFYVFENNRWVTGAGYTENISKNAYWYFNDSTRLNIKPLGPANLPLISINLPKAFGVAYAQDSIIVLANSALNDSIYVSANLGLTWNKRPNLSASPLSNIKINNKTIYLVFGNIMYESINFGQSWQSSMDDVISDYSAGNMTNFSVSDSSLFVTKGLNIYMKKSGAPKWQYANNIYSDLILSKIGDSTLLGLNIFPLKTIFQSKDGGKTWRQPRDFNFPDQPFISVKNTLYRSDNTQGKVYKSIDFAKTWVEEPTFPTFSSGVIKQDTVLLNTGGNTTYYSVSPYINWNSITSINRNRALSFDDGLLSLLIYKSVNNQVRLCIEQSKLDRTNISTIVIESNADFTSSFFINKNKIWVKNKLDTQNISFTKDLGATWVTYPLPKIGSTYDLKVFGDYLILNTNTTKVNGGLNRNTGGIYLSADDGKSWFLYSEGITLDGVPFDAKLTVIDSFIYANGIFSGLWRTTLKNLNLKSISGNVFADANRNGVREANEKPLFRANIYATKSGSYTTTDSLGNYTLLVDLTGTDTLKVTYDSRYSSSLPAHYLIAQSDSAKNFGILIPANDVKVNVTALTPPRPGFNNAYQITYKNLGSVTASGSISFTYNVQQSFISASNTLASNLNQTLIWNYTNLQPNESRVINLTLKTAVDMPIRTNITHVTTITPLSIDTFKLDNIDSLFVTVVGSYDPNDKQVLYNSSKNPPLVIDDKTELTYTIRFQNTGTYPADFVRITDTLSEKLDATSLRIIAASHPYTVSLRNKNVLSFDFNPIVLPDSTSNERDSHGFIKFSIKPKRALTNSEDIRNTGYIYFDYNSAIITNTTKSANANANSIGFLTPSVLAGKLTIFPNPAENIIKIEVEDVGFQEGSLSIYDVSGRLMLTKYIANKTSVINVNHLETGEYICTLKSLGNKVFVSKFVKL